MTKHPALLFKFLLVASLAHVAQAQELPVVGQTAVSTASRTEEQRDLGLQMLWLPLDSRTSLTDHIGRDLPGAALSTDGRLLLRGGRPDDTALELDGLRVRRMSLPLSMLERFDVASAGYGARWADVLGGVVSASTKSGDNRVHTDVGAFNELRDTTTRAVSGTASLPILTDRLFVLAGVRAEGSAGPPQPDPLGLLPTAPGLASFTLGGGLKLTWRPHPRHRFESLTLYEDRRDDNGAPLGIDPAAQPSVERRHLFTSLRWVGHISEAITVRNQLGFQSLRDEEMPLRCRREGDTCDALASMTQRFPINFLSNNWPRHQIEGQTEWQFVDGVEARLYQNDWIRERLVSSSRVSFLEARWRYHTPGDRELFFNGAERESERVTFATDPRQGPVSFGWSSWRGSALTALHSLESETRLRERLWIVPGVGITVDRVRSDLFTVASSTVTPHLDLAWDVWGDGRTWLRAASHQRATADAAALLSFSRGAPVTRQCQWDPDAASFTKSCVFSGGFTGTVGLPCGPDGVGADGAPCRTGLRAPRAWEHSLGAEQALGRGFRLAVDGVYRRPANLAETVETNRIWNSTGNTGNGFRNGRAQTVFDYANSDPGQRYLDLTVAVKKPDGAFQMLAAYTYSHYRGIAESPGPWGGAVGARGYYLDDVRPHSLRMLGSYDIAGYASVAAIYRHDSGRPLRWYRAVPQASFENTRGVNPGTTVNDPGDDGPTRLPDEDRLNLQVRLRGQRLVGVDVDLYADVINALEERRAFVPETSFAPAAVREGRWFRLGLEYRH